ncbi:MAG: serine--tRNA ligase [Clostridia bacterium]|nr:serine--tRNA ligase [Clostridia bacterium]
MLDINRIRENTDEVIRGLAKRNFTADFSHVIMLDDKRKALTFESENLKAQKNKVSADIPMKKKNQEDVSELLAEMKVIADKTKEIEIELNNVKKEIQEFLEVLPNIPADDVQQGGPEENKVVSVYGKKPEFSFVPKDHVTLCETLNLIDYKRGVKIGGNGFWVYTGIGAIVEWALLNYFVEEHLKDGYEFLLPPHILTYECGYTAGQFPKFQDDVFKLKEEENKGYTQFILPTAETALVNYHRDEILKEEELPKKYFAYTPCYRKEAGSYRAEERGMIRGHQFNKIEMFQYTTPENSDAALDELVDKAVRLMDGLGLHFRLSKLAAGDCSHSMAKTLDIEVWIPSMGIYKEVSSASNAKDYQARRGNIRFKREQSGKNEYLHTLNASGLATSRILPAIVEQFQNEDGSITIPEVLRKWIGKDMIKIEKK